MFRRYVGSGGTLRSGKSSEVFLRGMGNRSVSISSYGEGTRITTVKGETDIPFLYGKKISITFPNLPLLR